MAQRGRRQSVVAGVRAAAARICDLVPGVVGYQPVDRINHVKIVTPDPEAVDRFLRDVVDIPEGWSLGDRSPAGPPPDVRSEARGPDGAFTIDSVHDYRGADGFGGVITGSVQS